ncbi:MAG: glycosyltransferase family 39 protein [Chloroflexota bacterium]
MLPTSLRKPRLYFTLALALVYILGIGLRLYDITDEPLGYYPLRQLQGAIVARGIYYTMLPSADPVQRDRAVGLWHTIAVHEPLIQQYTVALTYLVVGHEIPWVASIYNLVFWLVSAAALYALAKRMAAALLKEREPAAAEILASISALLALAYFLLLPFGVLASRSFQPDPGMTMWILLFSYAIYRWSEEPNWKWALLAGVFAGLAVLIKAVAFCTVFIGLAAIALYNLGPRRVKEIPAALLRMVKNPQLWAILFLMVAPTALFYWFNRGRAGDYFSAYMLSLGHMLLSPSHYLVWFRLVASLLKLPALLIALAGVLVSRGRNLALSLGLWIGYFVYGLAFPYQMDTHSYYHLELVALVPLSMVPAFALALERLRKAPRVWQTALALAGVCVAIYFTWQSFLPIYRDDFRDQPAYWQKVANELPNDGKTIAITQEFGFRLLYYGWRKLDLWPNVDQIELRDLRGKSREFEEYFAKQVKGKRYFLITDFNEFDNQPVLKQYLYDNYPIIQQRDGYILFDLGPKT